MSHPTNQPGVHIKQVSVMKGGKMTSKWTVTAPGIHAECDDGAQAVELAQSLLLMTRSFADGAPRQHEVEIDRTGRRIGLVQHPDVDLLEAYTPPREETPLIVKGAPISSIPQSSRRDVKYTLLSLLTEHSGNILPTPFLLDRIGCAPASLHNAVASLRKNGYEIENVYKQGYRLPSATSAQARRTAPANQPTGTGSSKRDTD